MVMLEVFKETISVKYKAFLLSKATFITLVCDIITISLPFVLSYYSGGLWQKHNSLHLQPNVRFNGDFLLLAMSAQNQKPIVCSSFPYYKKYLGTLDACSTVKIREIDANLDNQVDALQFQTTIDLPEKMPIDAINIVLLLNYTLQEPCYFQMESAVIYQETNLRNVFQLSLYADLGLQQTESIKCSKNRLADMNLPIGNAHHSEDYMFDNFVGNYASKKIKTTLTNPITTYGSVKATSFGLNLNLKYPKHKIYYTPNLWQVCKFAWIQYIAIYIITAWLVSKIKSYIFMNNLVLFYKDRK
uniref:Transmembrane protein 231 n=1 Tax=Dendroctonus ponderosae TaxID=77166 RepID=A0AAR5P5Q0_DENPD